MSTIRLPIATIQRNRFAIGFIDLYSLNTGKICIE